MRKRVKLVCLVMIALAYPALALGGEKSTNPEWEKLLTRNLVSIRSDKMIFQEYSLCTFGGKTQGDAVKIQVKSYGEAPAKGVLSRDNFVAMNTELSTMFVLTVGAATSSPEKALESFDCKDLESPIGKPDLEFNLFVTKEGFKVELVNNMDNKRSGTTHTWAEVFSK